MSYSDSIVSHHSARASIGRCYDVEIGAGKRGALTCSPSLTLYYCICSLYMVRADIKVSQGRNLGVSWMVDSVADPLEYLRNSPSPSNSQIIRDEHLTCVNRPLSTWSTVQKLIYIPAVNDLRPQNCNGGFIVPPVHRGLKVGLTLGRSYLHFAPILGEFILLRILFCHVFPSSSKGSFSLVPPSSSSLLKKKTPPHAPLGSREQLSEVLCSTSCLSTTLVHCGYGTDLGSLERG